MKKPILFSCLLAVAACSGEDVPALIFDVVDAGGDAVEADSGGEDTGGDDAIDDTGAEDTGAEDTGADTSADVSDDAVEDVSTDVAPDADAGEDVGADVTPDTGTDTTPDVVDPCAELALCDEAALSCDADTAVTCAANEDGCLVETRVECATGGGTCDAETNECVGVTDPCALLVECEVAAFCDDDAVVICEADADGCLVETSREACVGVLFCVEGEDVFCEDPCGDVIPCAFSLETACDGDTANSCVPDENGCLVPAATDCEAVDGTCSPTATGGVCLPPDSGLCEVTGTLSCGDTMILANTADGASNVTSYECQTFEYPGNELIYSIVANVDGAVTVSATRLTGVGDFDLYALDGATGCDPAATCLASSTGTVALETVSWLADAGDAAYIFYDVFNNADTTTEVELTVTCSVVDCGDGAIVPGETCDDGNEVDGDGCTGCVIDDGFNCIGEPSECSRPCGDGTRELFLEDCDDGNNESGDGCSDACLVEEGYVCDGTTPDICITFVCGDGVWAGFASDEACDDGNDELGDGCDAECAIEEGALCDNLFGELSDCRYPTCGDARRQGEEECDDGVFFSEGCSGTCTIEEGAACEALVGGGDLCFFAACGNGRLDDGEECDDSASPACTECVIDDASANIGAAALPAACVAGGDLVCGDGGVTSTAACGECAIALTEGVISVTGALEEGDDVWFNPTSCGQTTGVVDHFVDAYLFTNFEAFAVEVEVYAEWVEGDGYLQVFGTSLDVANPSETCLFVDDDFNSTTASRIEDRFVVESGASIVVTASTFAGLTTLPDYLVRVMTVAPPL
jgi:cysteine-rich repeat protein